jgi:hypothetical protein
MTRKLEEIFDIDTSNDGVVDSDQCEPGNDFANNLPILPDTLATLDKIEQALPAVRGLESSDAEMDDLAAKATAEFQNLMDLGMNVDSRYASEIFTVASQMLGHAITAKNAKLNKKLKMIELQLKKARLDQDSGIEEAAPTGQGRVLDRNELLRTLIQRPSETKSNDK